MKSIVQILFLFILPIFSLAQNVAINNDGSTAHPNALLDVKGINKGLLIPRGDAATRTTLNTNTAKGLLMYDTILNTVWMHNGNGLPTGWNSLAIGTNYWQLNGVLGTEIRNINTGGFWSANATTVTTSPGVIQPPVSGAGTRLMWIPQKSAFRVGTVFSIGGDNWNADSIGAFSFATGYNTKANGNYSTAMGSFTTASGEHSIALGYNSTASSQFSTAMGSSTNASGLYSTAMGSSTNASGEYSTALGYNGTASGYASITMGFNSISSGLSSVAMGGATTSSGVSSSSFGSSTIASGNYSTALGRLTNAGGNISTAMGFETVSKSYASLSIGRYNDSITTSNPTTWVATDPLFQVGNGTSNANLHNAMVVYKNGNMVLKNPTTVTANPIGFTVPVSGAGTRMMWLPEKSAFRVGTVTGTQWDADSIGPWSFASGHNNKATNQYATAMGSLNTASGYASFAAGQLSVASGSLALAIGSGAEATNQYAIALGADVLADGYNSLAIGDRSIARGSHAMSMGIWNVAKAGVSLAIGRFNDSIATSNTGWVITDPIFYIGNGSDNNNRSNAMVVYKNGNTDINGYTQLGKASEGTPAIKMKKLTGTSASTQGGLVTIAHGLSRAKILGVQVLLTYAAGAADIPGPYLDVPGYEYNWQVTNTDINIYNKTGNSANILSKAIKILITYEE